MARRGIDGRQRRRRFRMPTVFAVVAALLAAPVSASPAVAADTAPQAVSNAVFDWGINNESNGGSFFGGCNFLSAGVAGNTGQSRTWTEADGFHRTEDGNTTIVRPTADGSELRQPTWASKCDTPAGTPVDGRADSGADSYTQTRVQIDGGTGTIDVDAGTADIAWEGSFTVVYYGGLTYWSATDPHLTVAADGSGTVTATLSGYGGDMDDPSVWVPITPQRVTLAALTGVQVTAAGLTATPDFLGLSIPDAIAGRNPQAVRTAANEGWWGAFPADFLAFQERTGQNSYWYTTDGGAGSVQPRKPPLPITVEVRESAPIATAPTIESGPASITVRVGETASFTVRAGGRPLRYQWQRSADGADWADISPTDHPGANSASLTLVAATADDGHRFRVTVWNDLGRVESDAATLTVRAGSETPGEPGPDDDEPQETVGAVFDWGINNESSGGAYFGGCNFLSAGVAGDAGSSRLWQASDGLYRTVAGNTRIVRPGADGSGLERPTWATKCQNPDGDSVNGKATSAADSYTRTRVRISGGTGTIDAKRNTADISWKGGFTVVYYGGLTYWSASDPRLVVDPDGSGTVTATLSGYSSEREDGSTWGALTPRRVVVAALTGVEVTPAGLTHTPDFLGVRVPRDVAATSAQPARDSENEDWWGAFPAEFLRFQLHTGQISYWHTTPGGSGTIQPRKVALPITVCATAECTVPATEASAGPDDEWPTIRQQVVKPPKPVLRAAPQAVAPPQAGAPGVGAEEVVIIRRITRAAPAAASAAVDERVIAAAGTLMGLLGLVVLLTGAGGVAVRAGVIRLPERRRR